jgi:hypothetical protein
MTGRIFFKWALGAFIFACAYVSSRASAEDDPIGGSCTLKGPQVYRPWHGEGFAKAISHIDCVWSERSMLLIGETHGTDETLDLVTALIEQQPRASKLAIGLEFPTTEDVRLRQFLKSPPTKEVTDTLLASDFWSFKDGRASQALLRFLIKIKEMKKEGRDIEVFGIEDVLSERRSPNPVANKELGMAAILKKRAELGQKLIAVGGNFHIRVDASASADSTTVPNQLRSYAPYVLLPNSDYGAAWTCLEMSDCGIHQRPQGMKAPSDEALLKAAVANGIYIENLDMPRLTASFPAKK